MEELGNAGLCAILIIARVALSPLRKLKIKKKAFVCLVFYKQTNDEKKKLKIKCGDAFRTPKLTSAGPGQY